MRRLLPLLPLLMLCAMLLSGCSGGIAPIVPPIIEPEEPEEPVYDGEPTSLLVKLQRDDVTLTKSLGFRSELTDTAYIRIEKKNENGLIVYRNMYKATIPADQPEIILPFELPSGQGYEVRGNVYRGDLLLGSAQPTTFDAPAKTVTTATLPLDPPAWEFFYGEPEALYSGGNLGQLRAATIPSNYWVGATVLCGFEPWDTNVNRFHPPQGIYRITGSSGPPLPPITEPQKLYYQVIVGVANEYEGTWEYAFKHFPDLTVETELPFIWCYPDPTWTD
jgi:hypothetical protein